MGTIENNKLKSTKTPVVTTSATQIYLGKDDMAFRLKTIMISNVTAAKVSLKLYDYDGTNGDATGAAWVIPQIYIDAYDTITLREGINFERMEFAWGIYGIASAATSCEVFVDGELI